MTGTPARAAATARATGGLDWRNHQTGPDQPCRICGRPAMCRDEHGRACHKVCAEQEPADQPTTTRPLQLITGGKKK